MSSFRRFLSRPFGWLIAVAGFLCLAVPLAWATMVIYYSNLPWAVRAHWVWRPHSRRSRSGRSGSRANVACPCWPSCCFSVSWSGGSPSVPRTIATGDRKSPSCRAPSIDGDHVRLTGVRNFDYRTRNDFTVGYEERDVLLSHLVALDFYVSYFTEGPVGHTFVSFIFDNAPPLSISIETRPEVGEGFAPVASLFKQFELIYVVGDERDIVGVRTNHRGEPVYLYRLNTSADDARRLLLVYLARINELADHPEFYHLLTNSCTINIVRYANAAGRAAGSTCAICSTVWSMATSITRAVSIRRLPFEELRRRSLINEAARAADGAPDFSQRIRASLPTVAY